MVKTTTSMKLWSYSLFHWNSKRIEDIRRILCEKGFFTNYHLLSLFHRHDPAVGDKDYYYNQYLVTLNSNNGALMNSWREEMHLIFSFYHTKWDTMCGTHSNITGQLLNGSKLHFIVTWWNNKFFIWYFYIFVKIWINKTPLTRTVTDSEK